MRKLLLIGTAALALAACQQASDPNNDATMATGKAPAAAAPTANPVPIKQVAQAQADPIQQDATTWQVTKPAPSELSSPPETLDRYPWQVATSAGCSYVSTYGRYAPYTTIDAIRSDGIRVDIMYDSAEFIMIGNLEKSPAPVMVFWRGGPSCDEIRARMAENHANVQLKAGNGTSER